MMADADAVSMLESHILGESQDLGVTTFDTFWKAVEPILPDDTSQVDMKALAAPPSTAAATGGGAGGPAASDADSAYVTGKALVMNEPLRLPDVDTCACWFRTAVP